MMSEEIEFSSVIDKLSSFGYTFTPNMVTLSFYNQLEGCYEFLGAPDSLYNATIPIKALANGRRLIIRVRNRNKAD